MSVMHFYLVCSMNKIGRSFVVCVLILVTTGTGNSEFDWKYKSSTEKTNWKQSTTTTHNYKWNKPTTTRWNKPSSTTTSKWKEPISTTTRWKAPTATPRWLTTTAIPKWKTTSRTTTSKKPIFSFRISTTTNKKIEPIRIKTTLNNKQPITTKNYKQDISITKWKQPITTTEWKRITPLGRMDSKVSNNNGVIAVASFSGIDSRNGRLSMDGVKVFPDPSVVNTDGKGNFFYKPVDGKISGPITITKQGDGFSGTIRILPGSVSVSSSSSSSSSPNSRPVSAAASYSPWKTSYLKPTVDDIYFHPFPVFPTIPDPIFDTRFPDTSFQTTMLEPFPSLKITEPYIQTRIQDPWFDKNMFKQSKPKYNTFSNNWFKPNFNPYFHYW